MPNSTIKLINTRIRLKSDFEDNWTQTDQFIPEDGEPIIYSKDQYHPYARIKIGDGVNLPRNLPFIDAGTICGENLGDMIIRRQSVNHFPAIGDEKHLYIDMTDDSVYVWVPDSSYVAVSKTKFTIIKNSINSVTSFNPGSMTTMNVKNGVGELVIGNLPELITEDVSVVTNVT